MADLVLRRDVGSVAVLTLNRPDKLNALSPVLFEELAAHLDAIEETTPGCVVLAGAGRSFCAGADVEALQAGVVTDDPEFRSRTMQRLGELPCPVIAAVQGHCYTGGLELALTADIIVADDDARFRDTHARFGILPRWGLSARLPRRIGLAAAKRMAFTGDEVPAAEALRIGLCDEIVPAARLQEAALELAARIAANARTSAGIKRLYTRSLELSLAEALENERASSRPGGGPGAAG
jgi:enoyl-CoA hydratase/carnithine racemase